MKKKVGIMTFHSVMNYGSSLQAIAMQNIMLDLGFDVELIDYRPVAVVEKTSKVEKLKKLKSINIWKKHIEYRLFAKRVGFSSARRSREEKYNEFFEKNMKLSDRCVNREELLEVAKQYDYLVCGSDQIWNPNYLSGDYSYFLDFCNDVNKKIAYAPSIAVDKIKDKDKEQFIKCVKDFKYVSVREKGSVELLKQLAGVSAQVVLDPTMLVDETTWEQYFDKEKRDEPYILSYFLGGNVEYQKAVLKLKELTGYKILNIPHMHLWSAREYYDFGDERLVDIGPSEFLSLIKNAEYICTDSFHGSVFSILNEKKFFAFKRYSDNSIDSENSRIYTLLDMLEITDRLVSLPEDINEKWKHDIDYLEVKKLIAREKGPSRKFLLNAFQTEREHED